METEVCVAYRCEEPAGRRTRLCPQHQRRLNNGGGLPTANEKIPGDPSGHGTYGQLDKNEHGIMCHECGQRYVALGIHANRAHNLTSIEYRQRHGIGRRDSLAMPRVPGEARRRPHPCNRCKKVLTRPGKLCDSCHQDWLHEQEERANRPPPIRRTRWRDLTGTEKAELAAADPTQLQQLIPALQLDRVPSRQIGAAIGLSPKGMSTN